jgi:MFS family permease
MDMVAKTIPKTRRGSFMAMRGFFGGLVGGATGLYVRHMLGDGGPVFPDNYALLFATASLFLVLAVSAFAAVDEPAGQIVRERAPLRMQLSRGWSIVREDRNYRLLVWVRVLLSSTMIGQVVFVPYALKALELPESIIGVLMIAATCFSLPSNFVWGHLGDRYGNRLLLLVGSLIFMLAPLCALVSWYVPSVQLMAFLPESYDARALLFIAAFVLAGIGTRGAFMGSTNYFLEIAPEDRRPSYQAFMRLLQAPAALMPLLGGRIAEQFSFQATFFIACMGGLATCALAWCLGEPRRDSQVD